MRAICLIATAMLLLNGRGAAPAMAQADPPVTGYHNDAARDGHYVVPGLTWTAAPTIRRDRSFAGYVPGHAYAQPLYWQAPGAAHGELIVATELNVVEAIDARTGAALWRRVLGRVVPRSALPCGDISPLGITGTPVLDPAAGQVYLDAFLTNRAGTPSHEVFALSLTDGSTVPGWPVDVAVGLGRLGLSFTPTIQNQRGALALANGEIYVPFGGNAGDCQAYHGWVVGLSVADHAVSGAWATRAQKGGIWSQGALADDGTSLFTATGNTSGTSSWGDGEAILRLPADLSHSFATEDYYTPSNWLTLDNDDADLGGTGPLPLDLPLAAGGTQPVILGLGKDGNAYLLDRTNLGGLGGALLVRQVANGAIITGAAAYPMAGGLMVAFHANGAACPGGSSGTTLVAIAIASGASGASPSLGTSWCAAFSGGGAPIVTTSDTTTDPIVWMVGGEGDEKLHGFRGDSGAVLFAGGNPADSAHGVRHLSTLIAAEGRLYVAGDGRVYCYVFRAGAR